MWDLLPFGAMEEVVKVMTHGATKYAPGNWRHVPANRYWAALMRHLLAFRKGEYLDQDSGLPHLSHALCNMVFLVTMSKAHQAGFAEPSPECFERPEGEVKR